MQTINTNPDGHKMSVHTDDVKAETLNNFLSVFSQENDYEFSTLPSKQLLHTMPPVIFSGNDILERLQRLNNNQVPWS